MKLLILVMPLLFAAYVLPVTDQGAWLRGQDRLIGSAWAGQGPSAPLQGADRPPPSPAAPDTPASLDRAGGWAARFESIEPGCRLGQTRLGATPAEATRTCACAVREIVSRSTDRQLELLLMVSGIVVRDAKPATAADAAAIRRYADALAGPIHQVCGGRVDRPVSDRPGIDELAAGSRESAAWPVSS